MREPRILGPRVSNSGYSLALRVQGLRAEFFGASEFGSSEILDQGFLSWRFGDVAFRAGCNSGLSTRFCGSEFGEVLLLLPPDPHLETPSQEAQSDCTWF